MSEDNREPLDKAIDAIGDVVFDTYMVRQGWLWIKNRAPHYRVVKDTLGKAWETYRRARGE
jgi:hypothetical protein